MKFPPSTLAQVIAVHPSEFAVSVVFPNLAMFSAVRVRVAADHASATSGRFELPQQDDWGEVAFYQDSELSGIWMTTYLDRRQHAAPLEILADDPRAQVDYWNNGTQQLAFSSGDFELAFPDGSLLKLTSSDHDPKAKTPRRVSVRDGSRSKREEYEPPKTAPAHLHLHRATASGGVDLDITPEGEYSLVLRAGGQEIYSVQGKTDGEVKLSNLTGAELTLQPSGGAALDTRSGAHVHISPIGAVDINAAAGMPVNVAGTGAPVAHVGSLVGPGPFGLQVLTGNPFFQTAPLP